MPEPDYILEEASELAKEARLFFRGIRGGFDIKRGLTPKQYVVFYLKNIKKLDYSVIADIVGVTESTVRVHYHNALKKTRKIAQKP